MNLEPKHVPVIFVAGLVGAGLGWVASFLLKPGLIPEMEGVVGLRGVGLIFGGVAAIGFAVIAIIVKATRDPNAGPARNFHTNQWNGIGPDRALGSYR